MAARRYRQQLIAHVGRRQRPVQCHALRVRHNRIGIALNGQDRRQVVADVAHGRQALRQRSGIGHAREPARGIGLGIGALDHILYIRHAEPVDHRRHLWRRSLRAGSREAFGVGNHGHRQGEMAASGLATDHNP